MNSNQIAAERDALLRALKLADEGVAQARASQQRAEAKSAQLQAELQALRSKFGALSGGNHPAVIQAQSAQKRAEAQAQYLEAQLRGQRMEFEALETVAEGLVTEKRELQAEIQELHAQIGSYVADMQAMKQEADEAKTELERLRALLLKATTGMENPVPLPPKSKAEVPGAARSKAVPPETRPDSEAGYRSKVA